MGEKERFNHFEEALGNSDQNILREGFNQGALSGLAMLVQQWVTAVQLWFGAWVLFNYPDQFDFRDFLISMMGLMFVIFGLGIAFQDIADRKETEKGASRIFYLLDRQSGIDPLSEEGKTVDTSIPRKSTKAKKNSIKKKKQRASSLKNVAEETSEEMEEDRADEANRSSTLKKKKSKRSSKKLVDDEDGNDTDKKPKTSKKKGSSKKNLNENEDGKKAKSSKKKKNKRSIYIMNKNECV